MSGSAPESAGRALGRRLLAELLATFAATLATAGAAVVSVWSHGALSHGERAVAGSLMTAALIYAVGDISGAHMNPAITVAFALRGVFRWRLVFPYAIAQLGGALLAGVLLRSFGSAAVAGLTRPTAGLGGAFAVEVLVTLVLVVVVLSTASRHKVVGPNAALAVATTVTLIRIVAEPLSGASTNPARSLRTRDRPRRTLAAADVYLVAPLVGAIFGVAVTHGLRGAPREGEASAAEGDDCAS